MNAWTARESYKNSLASMIKVQKAFGFHKAESEFKAHSAEIAQQIRASLKEIYEAQKPEEMNEYRKTIIEILSWIGSGYNDVYLSRVAANRPNIFFIMRKGIELLHVLFTRDLRRKVMTLNEKQMFADFKELTSKYEDPRNVSTQATNMPA